MSIEFVLGLALALVMHRTLVGKGLVRTAVLIPYGIVTVVASYSWYYAWTPGTGYLANLLPQGSAPLTEQIPSLGIVVLAEVWKTTPFMSLLLLAGLALVPEDLLKAAQVDGAGAWRRLTRITLPIIKPAVVVALLFRTLDAFRIFDNIYVLTDGANNTGSVSILGYDNLFKGFNVGLGSAISVLIFLCVGHHRVGVHQGVRRRGARGRGRWPLMQNGRAPGAPRAGPSSTRWWWCTRCFRCCGSLSLSLKPTSTVKDGKLIPSSVTLDNYRGIFRGDFFSSALINSDRHRVDHHGDRGGARRDGGLRGCPTGVSGQAGADRRRAADRDVPGDLAGDAVVQHRALHRPVRHLARADHAVHHLRAAAGDLHAVGVLPGDPLGSGEGGQDGRRHAGSGVPQGDRAAGGARAW